MAEKPEIKELCKQFEDSLPDPPKETLKALGPKPNPKRELYAADKEYKNATQALRRPVTKKAELQHEIDHVKETYRRLLSCMQDLRKEEQLQQDTVQNLQKGLHERVAGGAQEKPLSKSLTCMRRCRQQV